MFDFVQFLQLCGASIISISALVGAIAVVEKFFKESRIVVGIRRIFIGRAHDKLDELFERISEMEMWQLKQIMDDRRGSLETRLVAGEQYLKRGGNGAYQVKIEALREQYRQEILK